MIFHQFPDLAWLKAKTESNFRDRIGPNGRILPHDGWPTVILNVETSSTYRDNIRGPLSVFTNFSGESLVATNNKTTRVRPGFFYLSNPGQHYTLAVDQKKTETFNIHFGTHFAEQVMHALDKRADVFSDVADEKKIEFHNRLYRLGPETDALMAQIRHSADDPLLLEQRLFEFMVIILSEHRQDLAIEHSLPSFKASTRQEIARRLFEAADFIHASYDQDISLDALARVSCLSKFHFLRLFKIAFNETPYQFVNRVRIERAMELLKRPTLPVSEVAAMVGVKDASSFSRLFRSQVGVYPSAFRVSA